MKFYTVTAHHQNSDKSFRITYPAMSCGHAGAKFITDMILRGSSVMIEKASGELEDMTPQTPKKLTNVVILDRIQLFA